MAVTTTWKKTDYAGKYKTVHMRMDYEAADASVVCTTGLKIIMGYTASPPSVATKYVTGGAVAGGTVTLTVTAPGAGCYLYLSAWGIP